MCQKPRFRFSLLGTYTRPTFAILQSPAYQVKRGGFRQGCISADFEGPIVGPMHRQPRAPGWRQDTCSAPWVRDRSGRSMPANPSDKRLSRHICVSWLAVEVMRK
jgi:hypothetical protein